MILLNAQRGMAITHKRIFQAVAAFCGKSPRTVRYYYETAIFFPPEVRKRYDMLPFSHFVEARSFGDAWTTYLETAMLYPHSRPQYIRQIILAGVSQNLTLSGGASASLSGGDNGRLHSGYADALSADGENFSVADEGIPVAAGGDSVTAQGSGFQALPLSGSKIENWESSHSAMHECLGLIDGARVAVSGLIPVIEAADGLGAKGLLLAACRELLKYLPALAEYYSRG